MKRLVFAAILSGTALLTYAGHAAVQDQESVLRLTGGRLGGGVPEGVVVSAPADDSGSASTVARERTVSKAGAELKVAAVRIKETVGSAPRRNTSSEKKPPMRMQSSAALASAPSVGAPRRSPIYVPQF